MLRSLILKLTVAFLAVGLTGALLVAVLTGFRTRAAFGEFIVTREQQILASNLVIYYQMNGDWQGVDRFLRRIGATPERTLEARRDFRNTWDDFTLVNADRQVIFSSLPEAYNSQITNRDLERAITLVVDGTTVGWLLVKPLKPEWILNSPESIFLRNVNSAALLSAGVAAGLALLLGGLLAFTMTRSLRALTDATNDIARGDLGRQVEVHSNDEFGELAASFNKMSSDLAQSTRARRQMTADIAHELRTPLSVIAGYTEAISEGKLSGDPETFAILHRETQQLSRLIEDLRLLSLADAGELLLTLQPADPGALLEQSAARHNLEAQKLGLSLQVQVEENLPSLQLDIERIGQVLDNLITNAFRHTPAGGDIVLTAGLASGCVRFTVRDTGSGINPDDQPFIFNRFYRGDKSRSTTGESGLGLAIAKSIIQSHGGDIWVESEGGRGASFIFSFPLDTNPPN
jgi:two-component system, OmpR family, sensor histidine kinase BaeS